MNISISRLDERTSNSGQDMYITK